MKMLKRILTVIVLLITFSCTEEGDILNPQEDRDKFIGTWNVNETCNRIPYQVTIIKDPSNSSQVIIENFWLIGPDEKPPYAIAAGNTIVIPQQNICNDDKTIVNGTGNFTNNVINWEYTVNDGADLYTCIATYTKD